jgi:hypothetical protein
MTIALWLVLGAAGLLGWLTVAWRWPHVALLTILLVLTTGSHVLALLYTAEVPAGPLRAALVLKDLLGWTMLFALVLRALATRRRITPAFFVVGALGVIGGFLVLRGSPAPLSAQLESVRGAMVPFVSLGCAAFMSEVERARAAIGAVVLAVLAAVYAMIEMTLPRAFLTSTIGVGKFWVQVKDVPLFVDPDTGLPYNFSVTSGFPRLTGSFGDPLSAGAILAVALVLALAYRHRLRLPTVCALVLGAALLLTFTRGGWLIALFGLVALALLRLGWVRTALLGVVGAVTAGLAVAVVAPLRTYLTGILAGKDSSTLAHQEALSATARLHFSWWGDGWGTGGSVAQNSYSDAVSAESTYVALLAQIGVVGTLLLGVLVVGLALSGLRHRRYSSVGAAMLIALALGGIVSENMLTFTGAFPVFAGALLVTGAAIRRGTARAPADEVPDDVPAGDGPRAAPVPA